MKKTGPKKLELKRLTVKQLSNASGAGWYVKSYNAACSGSCTSCDPNNSACYIFIEEPTDNCASDGCGGGGGCGGGQEYNNMC
jgi:hypothetical protein